MRSTTGDRWLKLGRFARLVARGNFREAGAWASRVARARVERVRFVLRYGLAALDANEEGSGLPYTPPDVGPYPEARSELRRRLQRLRPAAPPLVSVIVPCHDYGDLVAEAVQSVLDQTWPHVEIVVVDDGSTDPVTLRTLERLRGVSHVRVIRQENRGLVGARRRGVEESRGELLLFLDNDDALEPEAVELLAATLLENPDAAFAWPDQRFFGDRDLVWETQEWCPWDLLWSNHPTVCALIRRAWYERAGGYDAGFRHGWEDWNHWLSVAEAGGRGIRVPVPLFRHRRHGRTMTHTAAERGRELRRALRDRHPSLYAADALRACKAATRPAISVVIPFCNAHGWLEETLASLEIQTLRDFEVVVVDDASDAPESLALLERLGDRSRVRVLRRTERGDAAAARNTGAEAARGDHLVFLDADDLLEPTALEKLLWAKLLTPRVGFTYAGVVHFGRVEATCLEPYDRKRLARENFLTSFALIPRELYLDVGGMDETVPDLHEDWDFWLRLASLSIPGRLVPEPLFRYRRHDAGRSARVDRGRTPESVRSELRRRNPVAFGDRAPQELPPWYRPRPRPTAGPVAMLAREFSRRFALEDSSPRESYRRPNVPDPLGLTRPSDERIGVLYLVPHLTVGGAERVDLDILEGLPRDRFRVVLVTELAGDDAWRDRFQERVDELFELDALGGDEEGRGAFLEYLVMSRDLSIVLNRNTSVGYTALGRLRDLTNELACVDMLHLHNSGEDWVRISAEHHDRLDRRFVITEDLRDYACATYGISPDRFEVVHCGVDPAKFHPDLRDRRELRSALGLGDEPLVAFVGRLDEQKDPRRWVRVAAAVAAADPSVRFALIGDGPLRATLEREISRGPLAGRATLLGNRDDVASLLADADLLLLTSRYEGLPLVVFEAFAVGTAVVASDVGGTRECVTPELGRLLAVDASDREWGEAVRHELATARDPARRTARRRQVLDHFTVQRMRATWREELTALAAGLRPERRRDDFLDRLQRSALLP